MSFQAYLDAIEDKTGHTPRELLELAWNKGLDAPSSKAADVAAWLKEDYGLGRGHAMAFWHVSRNGPTISDKHVGSSGSHRDDSESLWLDGRGHPPRELSRRRPARSCTGTIMRSRGTSTWRARPSGYSHEGKDQRSAAMKEFSLDQHPVDDGVLRLAVSGEVDLANSEVLAEAIRTAIKKWSVAEVVVDLDQVTFLDSSGISVLVAGYNLAADYGVAYFVVNPHDLVRRTLDITGVLTTLSEQP